MATPLQAFAPVRQMLLDVGEAAYGNAAARGELVAQADVVRNRLDLRDLPGAKVRLDDFRRYPSGVTHLDESRRTRDPGRRRYG